MQDTALLESLGGSPEIQEESNQKELSQPSSHYSRGVTSSVEERALTLLGSGISGEAVAAALGVTPSRIAQLLADESFAAKVAQLRYDALQQHNVRDSVYDRLEDKLLGKLEKSLPLMFKPEVILKAIATINGAKRRGVTSPEHVTNNNTIVNLVLPNSITSRFVVDVNLDNQVIRAGEQDLLTMPAANLLKKSESRKEALIEHAPSPKESSSPAASTPSAKTKETQPWLTDTDPGEYP